VAGRMVRIPRRVLKGRWYVSVDLTFFSSDGTRSSGGNKGHMQ